MTTDYACTRCRGTVFTPNVAIQLDSKGKAIKIADLDTFDCVNCALRVSVDNGEINARPDESSVRQERRAKVVSSVSAEERLGRRAPIRRDVMIPRIRGDVDGG